MKEETRTKRLKRFSKRLMKGKPFRKSEFGTGFFDKTPRGMIGKLKSRSQGHRPVPVKLELQAQDKSRALDKVCIYIGTESAQHRAERVLLWSIYKHRDPDRDYEIYLMKDLLGFNRDNWKTGFTAYRYAIPGFTGYQGRAIYNDVDQIYLRDPGALLDEDMHGAGVLAVESRDTSVMLLDCQKLQGIWTLEGVKESPARGLHTAMLRQVRHHQLISDLPGHWNSRDHEYHPQSSSLLHYTILHTQPWQPFPRELRYRDNPQGKPWFELEHEADEAGFVPLWKTVANRPYGDLDEFFTVAADA
ncbi:hypothetical protein N9241_01410 [bacterium]|nr:hypothetical protein [bacterium]